jgi:hypothetical protein
MKTMMQGVVVVMMSAAGCAVAPADSGAAGDGPTATSAEALSVGGSFTPFGYTGGGGGGGPYWLACNGPDEVVAGFFGHSGTTIDQIGVVCATLNSNGSVQSYDWPQTWFGGNGGSYFQVVCPENQFATGIWMNWESTVNGLSMICQTAAEAEANSKSEDFVTVVNNAAEYLTAESCNEAGWGGAINPRGAAAVKGFWVKASTYVDALEPVCVPLLP